MIATLPIWSQYLAWLDSKLETLEKTNLREPRASLRKSCKIRPDEIGNHYFYLSLLFIFVVTDSLLENLWKWMNDINQN